MKIIVLLIMVIVLSGLTSAQVAAPTQSSVTVASQRFVRNPDGTTDLRGNVKLSVIGPVEIEADEAEGTSTQREFRLRGNVIVRLPPELR